MVASLFLDDNCTVPKNCSVLWAVPSFGNVGQLAADCLIATLPNIRRIGSIESHHLIPMIGYDKLPNSSGNFLCMPLEVYIIASDTERPFLLLQQRSPCRSLESMNAFAQDMSQLLSGELQCKSYMLLCGANIERCLPQSLQECHQRQRFFNSCGGGEQAAASGFGASPQVVGEEGWLTCMLAVDPPKHAPGAGVEDDSAWLDGGMDGEADLPAPSSPVQPLDELVRHVQHCLTAAVTGNGPYKTGEKNSSGGCTFVLGRFCHEGNNVEDGECVAYVVRRHVLGSTNQAKFSHPFSWNSLLGAPLPTNNMFN